MKLGVKIPLDTRAGTGYSTDYSLLIQTVTLKVTEANESILVPGRACQWSKKVWSVELFQSQLSDV